MNKLLILSGMIVSLMCSSVFSHPSEKGNVYTIKCPTQNMIRDNIAANLFAGGSHPYYYIEFAMVGQHTHYNWMPSSNLIFIKALSKKIDYLSTVFSEYSAQIVGGEAQCVYHTGIGEIEVPLIPASIYEDAKLVTNNHTFQIIMRR